MITHEDFSIEFCPDTWQQSKLFQFLSKSFSKWSLLNKYYQCKSDYYKGHSSLTDQEFDSLEGSIKAIAGVEFLDKYGCVGYDVNHHNLAKDLLSHFDNELKRKFTGPWNNLSRIKVEVVSGEVMDRERTEQHTAEVITGYISKEIVKKIEEVREMVFEQNDLGQFTMGF